MKSYLEHLSLAKVLNLEESEKVQCRVGSGNSTESLLARHLGNYMYYMVEDT